MKNVNIAVAREASYENFISYFENYYFNELSCYQIYEKRMNFLEEMKKKANEHKRIYESKHGMGSYNINLSKYGELHRTPLQIIIGDFNCTHLIMPRNPHNYFTQFGHRHKYI